MKKAAAMAASTLLLGGGMVAATAIPAHAENYANAVCNSDYSVETIRVYSNYPGAVYSYLLAPGQCVSRPWNGLDNLRVDVEDCTGFCTDVNSYKIGEINVGWGPCHEDSENNASNPPDSYNANGIRYRNYNTTRCS